MLLTCCTVILRFEDGRIKAQYPMDAAGAEKVKHFFTAKPDAQEEKELRQYRIILSADTDIKLFHHSLTQVPVVNSNIVV